MERLTILIGRPNKSVTPSSTNRTFYASRRHNSSACGIPTLPCNIFYIWQLYRADGSFSYRIVHDDLMTNNNVVKLWHILKLTYKNSVSYY